MKFLMAIVFALTIYTPTTYGELTMKQINEIEKGTCKVISQNGRSSASGSGFFIKQDDTRYFICTNAHVINDGNSFKIRRYENTNKTIEIPSKLIARYYREGTDLDFAFLTVDKRFFKNHPPTILKLASDISIPKNTKVFGWGFPNGHGSHFWRHRVIEDSGNTIETNIAFASGQSGGPALSFIDNEIKVIGLVTWRYDDKDTGGIISVNRLWDVLNKKQTKINVVKRKHTRLQKTHVDSCNICGHPREYHYQTINVTTGQLSKELYCPESVLNVKCPNGQCPPNYYYNNGNQKPYYRYRGFSFGIGNAGGIKPQNPDINLDSDIWIDREDEPKTNTPSPEAPKEDIVSKKKLAELKSQLDNKTSELLILKEKYNSLEKKTKTIDENGKSLSKEVSVLKKINDNLKEKVKSLIEDTKNTVKDALFGDSFGKWTSLAALIMGIASGGSIPLLFGRFFAKRAMGRVLGIVKKVKFFKKTTDSDGNEVIVPSNEYVIDDSFKMDKPKKKSIDRVKPVEEKSKTSQEVDNPEVYNTIEESKPSNDAKNKLDSRVLEKQDINIENNHYISLDGTKIPELNEKAKSRYEHITSEKFDKKQFCMGVLYEEAVIKLKNGHFRIIGDIDAANTIINYVESKLADKIIEDGKIFDEVTSDNTKHYYVIKCMYYSEAMEKLKNKDFGDIKRPEDIAKAIELFVQKKIINNYTK